MNSLLLILNSHVERHDYHNLWEHLLLCLKAVKVYSEHVFYFFLCICTLLLSPLFLISSFLSLAWVSLKSPYQIRLGRMPKNTRMIIIKTLAGVFLSTFDGFLLVLGTSYILFNSKTGAPSEKLKTVAPYFLLGLVSVMFKWMFSKSEKRYAAVSVKLTNSGYLYAISQFLNLDLIGCHPVTSEAFSTDTFFCLPENVKNKKFFKLMPDDVKPVGPYKTEETYFFKCSYSNLLSFVLSKKQKVFLRFSDGEIFIKKEGIYRCFGFNMGRLDIDREKIIVKGSLQDFYDVNRILENLASDITFVKECDKIEILHSLSFREILDVIKSGKLKDFKTYKSGRQMWVAGEARNLKRVEIEMIRSVVTDVVTVMYHNIKFFGCLRVDYITSNLSSMKNFELLRTAKSKLYRSDLFDILKGREERIGLCPYKSRRSEALKTLNETTYDEKVEFLGTKGYHLKPSDCFIGDGGGDGKSVKRQLRKLKEEAKKNFIKLSEESALESFVPDVESEENKNESCRHTHELQYLLPSICSVSKIDRRIKEWEIVKVDKTLEEKKKEVEELFRVDREKFVNEILSSNSKKKKSGNSSSSSNKDSEKELERREKGAEKLREKYNELNKRKFDSHLKTLGTKEISLKVDSERVKLGLKEYKESLTILSNKFDMVKRMGVALLNGNKERNKLRPKYKVEVGDIRNQVKIKNRERRRSEFAKGPPRFYQKWQTVTLLFVYLIGQEKLLNRRNEGERFTPIRLKGSRWNLRSLRKIKNEDKAKDSFLSEKIKLIEKNFDVLKSRFNELIVDEKRINRLDKTGWDIIDEISELIDGIEGNMKIIKENYA
jgi:hypothetical protein